MPMSVQVMARARAKVRMEIRDGAKAAAKIEAKAAAINMLAKVAKVWRQRLGKRRRRQRRVGSDQRERQGKR